MSGSEFHGSTPKRGRQPKQLSAMQRGLNLLTRREHSKKELERKLLAKGLDQDEVSHTLNRLSEAGWQDDVRFAESVLRARVSRGYGPLYIRAELSTHSISPDTIAAVLQECEVDWVEQIVDVCHRRFRASQFDDLAYRHNVTGYLIRHGFETDHIRAGIALVSQRDRDQRQSEED